MIGRMELGTMKISTQTKLMQLRSHLNTVSDVSYAFTKMNRQYPLDSLDEETAKEVIIAYTQLLNDISDMVKSYSRGQEPLEKKVS